MELFQKFVIFVLVAQVFANKTLLNSLEPSDSQLSQSVSQLIRKFYTRKGSSFHVVRAVEPFNNHLCNDIISEILHNVSDTIPKGIESFNQMVNAKNRKKFSVIIFTDSLKSLIKFFEKFTSPNYKFRRFFSVVLIEYMKHSEIESIFKLFWKLLIRNVNLIMMNDNGTVALFTFMPFNERKCGDTSPLIINTFDKDLMKWVHDEFHPVKTRNLYQCPLIITGAALTAEPSFMIRNDSNGNIEMYGSEKDIFLELSKKLNFAPIFEAFGSFPGLVFENGTSTGNFLNFLHHKVINCNL